MTLIAGSQHAEMTAAPRCVAQLLSTLEALSAALAEDRPNGPYALDAVLDDVVHCPAIEAKSGLANDSYPAVVDAVTQARNAAKVLRACPGSDRQWAVERLREAVEQARRQIAARAEDAEASGNREGLFGRRCAACVFGVK
ncbi:MAG: hypothetical protein APF80_08450 [Alphaproteobacteria bacterium BRH_c36]|nr:MAG: hypothetical protein APF80_08450 [Alphaproteobacteria bacterium BRH_c36]